MKKSFIPFSLCAGLLLWAGLAQPAEAQFLNYTTGTIGTSGNDGDVVLVPDGTVVDAYYFGAGAGVPTLNGVAFTIADWQSWQQTNVPFVFGSGAGSISLSLGNLYDVGNTGLSGWSSLSATYQKILVGAGIGNNSSGGSTPEPIALVVNNLTVGATYQAEFWVTSVFSSSETITLGTNTADFFATVSGGGSTLGSYTTATFIATATSETFSFNNSNDSILNAFDLIEAPVPEPSTIALLSAACGLVGLVAVRRYRLASV